MEDYDMIKKISLFVVIQVIYFIYIIVLRPQADSKENLNDFINEIFYLFYVVFLLNFNTENKWTDTITDAYFWILMANNFILIFIILIATLRLLILNIRKICIKFKVKPKPCENSTKLELVNQIQNNYSRDDQINEEFKEENKESIDSFKSQTKDTPNNLFADLPYSSRLTARVDQKVNDNNLIVEDMNEDQA